MATLFDISARPTGLEAIRFEVPGIPVAKGRPKLTTINGSARAFTPAKTVAYEGKVALAGERAMDGRAPLTGAIAVEVIAWFPIPQSWSKKRKLAARFHTGRPDADNILKAIGDGLNGVIWADDSQIAEVSIHKRYAGRPCVAVTVREISP